jgi:pimeloyl-ACP methyl ester carboxylesterase
VDETAKRTKSIELDGRRLAWRTLGQGPPLLLVNGYAATAADWDPRLLSILADSFELICPDNRGVGGSELGELRGLLTVDALAADLEVVLGALEIDRLPIVGWSLGGFVAQALATRVPRQVEALVLLSTDPGGTAAVPPDPDVWERLTDHSGTPREQATRLISLLFPPPVAKKIERDFGDVVAAARADLSPIALRAQEVAMDVWHAADRPAAAADPPPVLAVCGGEDVVIPPQNGEALAERWPGCQVERFEGGGHAFMAQEPERLADLIASFLRDVTAGNAKPPRPRS